MTLDEYIEKSINDIKKFKEQWIKDNQSDSETFPLEMDEEKWKFMEEKERF